MARDESDREDLIREATALQNRVEWRIRDETGVIFAGVRSNGSLAIYFGPDPVYQFSIDGGLRRAYAGGFLYRTQGTTLAKLVRRRSSQETLLHRSELNSSELSQFLSSMDEKLTRLVQSIADGSAAEIRSVSDGTAPDYETLINAALNASPRLAPAILTRRR